VSNKSQKALKLHMIFCLIFLKFITDWNQLTIIRNRWNIIPIFCAYATSLNTKKFITPVYKNEISIEMPILKLSIIVISLTLMAHMHKMLRTYNNISVSWIKNMFYNHVYSQQPSYLMEFKCNFHLMPVFTFKLVAFCSYDFWICKG